MSKSKLRKKKAQIWENSINDFCCLNDVNYYVVAPSQIRVSGRRRSIDIFPQSERFHDIVNNIRGQIPELQQFLDENFGVNV